MMRSIVTLFFALSLTFFTTGYATSGESYAIQKSDIVGAWLSPRLNYLWHFRDDQTFDNERGTKGVWSVDGGFLIAKATNQGSNSSNYNFRLTNSGNTLEGSWSDPSGSHGEFILQKR